MKTSALLFLRFTLGGGVGVLVAFAVLYLLTEFADIWYVASSICAGIVCFILNFYIHKFWTFKSTGKKGTRGQMVMYGCLNVVSATCNPILLWILVENMHLHYMTAQVVNTASLGMISFILTRKIFSQSAVGSG